MSHNGTDRMSVHNRAVLAEQLITRVLGDYRLKSTWVYSFNNDVCKIFFINLQYYIIHYVRCQLPSGFLYAALGFSYCRLRMEFVILYSN